MKIKDIRMAVVDIWGPVLIENTPIVEIHGEDIFLNDLDEPLFGDEVLEELETYSNDTEVFINWI